MSGLIVGDFFQVVVENLIKANAFKVGQREVCKTLAVELVLEVLQSQRKVEDIGLGLRQICLPERSKRLLTIVINAYVFPSLDGGAKCLASHCHNGNDNRL